MGHTIDGNVDVDASEGLRDEEAEDGDDDDGLRVPVLLLVDEARDFCHGADRAAGRAGMSEGKHRMGDDDAIVAGVGSDCGRIAHAMHKPMDIPSNNHNSCLISFASLS